MGYIAMQSIYHAHWAVIHWICMVGAGAMHGVVRHHGVLHISYDTTRVFQTLL